jgi:ADP-heptose:LPS heptosyltransferase
VNIVVTRLQNIGDMLVFIPALRLLRQALPDAYITLLAKHAQGVEMVEDCPFVDRIVPIRNPSFFEKMRVLLEFRRLAPELFIVSPQDQGKVPWAVLGGAKRIAAFKSVVQRGVVKKEKLPFMVDVAPPFLVEESETENSVRLVAEALKSVGAEPPEKPALELEYSWFKKDSPEKVEAALREAGVDPARPYAVSAMFSKAAHKNWPSGRFDALHMRLAARRGLQIVLVGGAKDREPCREFAFDGGPVFNLAGKLSLDQSAWLLKGAALYIGNDSGPSHLASAVGVPSLVFYRKESHSRWRLPASKSKRIELVAESDDIREISLEAAIEACEKILEPSRK